MPKLITIQHPDEVAKLAREYVKTYILMPSGLVGMFCLVVGVIGLGYQLIASESYTWDTFYYSSGLMALGVMVGTAQTQYHLYLFRQFPDALAARMRRGPTTQRALLFFDPPDRNKHDWIGIAMGALDTSTGAKIALHIFTAEKGDYYDIPEGEPQHSR